MLSARNYVVITHLYQLIYNLINQDLNDVNIVTDVKILTDNLLYSLNKKFNYLLSDSMFKAFKFLDFDYKNFEFLEDVGECSRHISEAKQFLFNNYEKNKDKFNDNPNQLAHILTSKLCFINIHHRVKLFSSESIPIKPVSINIFKNKYRERKR